MGTEYLERGLSAAEVDERTARGAVNRLVVSGSQSWAQILKRNTLTRLNLLLVMLGGATLITGSAPDATFLGIAAVNTVVGAVEEARAKRELDRLAVINAAQARVVRDGQVKEVLPDEVVIDDLLDLQPGDQLIADAVVVTGSGEFDESLATGESDPVSKNPGDTLLSGSWLIAGAVRAAVTAVGADSYANRLVAEARRFSLAGSELMTGINQVLRWLSWAMVVIAPILVVRELASEPWRLAIRLAVAGLVGMIPEGLVLLTTLAFLAAALRLARSNVLVQELPAVETLARVDTLCVDKTGTLTEGRIAFSRLTVRGAPESDIRAALAALASARGTNATLAAIGEALAPDPEPWSSEGEVPFSSARKWSAASFAGHGSWILGAPEVIDAADPHELRSLAASLAASGSRVLALARSAAPLVGEVQPDGLTLVALVELAEQVRPEVSGTLAYFARQNVTTRVLSGDNPLTVRSVAEKVGIPDAELAVDARTLPSHEDPSFAGVVESTRVFGRVVPEQKRHIVAALQSRGHTVAMTGDGVNDVLALKDAELGVAMGSGSAITRGVAQVVILDDNFDVLPSVVAEGRRVLANIEVAACLFLVKNVYSLILSVAVSITGWPYPFLPRHLTLISAVGIGIPGFFLALAPNERRFVPGFLRRVLTFSFLAGAVTAGAVLLTYATAREEGLTGDAARTAAITVTVVVSLWVLWIVSRPTTPLRALLVVAMAGLFLTAFVTPGVDTFFSLQHRFAVKFTVESLAFGVGAAAIIDVASRWGPIRRLTNPGARPRYGARQEDGAADESPAQASRTSAGRPRPRP